MEKANVKRVVLLSAAGAELTGPTGHLQILREAEKELDDLVDVQKTYLRPGVFMENILDSLPLIKAGGYIGTPFNPNVALSYVKGGKSNYGSKCLIMDGSCEQN